MNLEEAEAAKSSVRVRVVTNNNEQVPLIRKEQQNKQHL